MVMLLPLDTLSQLLWLWLWLQSLEPPCWL